MLFARAKTLPPPSTIQDPFAVVPFKPENVELRRDSEGLVHLRLTPPLSRFRRKTAEVLHYDYTRKIELDEYGTHYYSLVDGIHTLQQIVEKMAARFGKDRNEMADSVVLFTKKLMTIHMLALRVPGNAEIAKTP
jgi:hypothetical protein